MIKNFASVPQLNAFATLIGHTNSVDTVCCLPKNRSIIASGSHDFLGKIWDTNTGKCIRELKGHTYFFLIFDDF